MKYERPRHNSKVASPSPPAQQASAEDWTMEQDIQSSNTGLPPDLAEDMSNFDEQTGNLATMANESWSSLDMFWELRDLAPDTNVSLDLAEPVTEELFSGATDLPQAPTILVPTIPPSPTHIPTTLIEYWFCHICPLRSTFDSGINYNRQMAWNTWASSEAVSNIMQAMSAACLVQSMPQLKEIVPSLRSRAIDAVSVGIARVQESSTPNVTADLIFAVLSLGTSLHWFARASLSGAEVSWLDSARNLLSLWKPGLATADSLLHAYFPQALTYWKMLLAPLGHGSIPAKIRKKRQRLKQKLENTLNLSSRDMHCSDGNQQVTEDVQNTLGTRPNSWCGLSSEVIHTYGQVLALCRGVSIRATDTETSAVTKASDVLCDMSNACGYVGSGEQSLVGRLVHTLGTGARVAQEYCRELYLRAIDGDAYAPSFLMARAVLFVFFRQLRSYFVAQRGY